MKKYFNLIVCLLLIIININVVKAEECDSIRMYANSDFWGQTGLRMNYGSKTNYYSLYTLKNSSGAAFSSYCRNPGISAGKNYNGQTFYCDHTVFDATSDDETVKIYDAGIVEILKKGYSTRNSNSTVLSSNKEYAATNLALRIYEMLWPDLNTNGNNNTGVSNAHKYYVNKWLDDETINSLLKSVVGKVRSKFSNYITVTSWTDSNGTAVTSEVESEAKRLVILGLEAAKYYKENGAATLKGVDDKPIKEKDAVITDENGVKSYRTSLTYRFEVDKFKSSNAYIKINFNCYDCSNYDVSVEYEVLVDNNAVNYDSNTNLVKYLKDGKGTIDFIVTFSGTSENYKCEQLDYSLNLEYFDDTISVEAYDMYSEGCKSNYSCQHFYMLYANDVSTKKTIEDTLELCSLSCKEAQEGCNAGNKSSCEIFYDKYGGDCAECTTYINNAACTEDDSEIDIVEGYDVDIKNCGNITEDNNLNVLQCIIGNTDDAGNSYKATDLVSNEFCSVYCKEDYHFTLPGQKEVNSGRYFSLKASIEGTKTCYTSKIDEDGTFSSQLETARQKVINAYNEWSKYNAIVNAEFEYVGQVGNKYMDGETYTGTCYRWDKQEDGTLTKEEYSCPKCRYIETHDCYTDQYKKSTSYITYSTAGVVSNNKFLEYYGSASGTSKKCRSGSCSKTSYLTAYNAKGYESKLSEAKSTLNSAINTYVSLINRYNACSGINTVSYNVNLNYSNTSGWKMDYDYDPTISFWYEESYMNDVLTDELETVGSIDKGNVTQQICTSDTNNSYKSCSTGWKTSLNKSDTTSQFVCKKTSSGYECGSYNLIISKSKYVKQEISVSANYQTPTQFYSIYPSGAIVVAEAGNEDNIENSSELTNLLPVGLGTTQGVYTYALKVTNLGEYYNNSKLGRIWGNKNSVVVNVLEKADEKASCTKEGALTTGIKVDNTIISNGVYVCAYKVNCPDCPVECDPTCKDPNCPDGDCPVECDGCVITNSSTNFTYKPVSPGNINPNDREMGVNWKYNENSISTALELKAYATTKEIEEAGETIYDIDYEDTSSDNEFAMKITLDSTLINKIRTYNDEHEDDGGYANNTLKCYDYTQDGKTYDNIYCYSTFIDELLYDNSTKDKIKIVGNRIIGTDAKSSDNLRKTQTQTSGYWTTWAEANSSKWTITTQNGIAYYKQNYSEIGIGPSWK